MRKTQCEKGHYYDADHHSECPVCEKLKKTIAAEPHSKQISFITAPERVSGDEDHTVLLDQHVYREEDVQPSEQEQRVPAETAAHPAFAQKTVCLRKPAAVKLVCVAGKMKGVEYELYDNEIIRIGESDFAVKLIDEQ